MRRILILGASSGLGKYLANAYINKGDIVGIGARRVEELEKIKAQSPQTVFSKEIDVSKPEAKDRVGELIQEMGGMDVFIYCSGFGKVNPSLDFEIEKNTIDVNINGFILLVNYAYKYFKEKGEGQIVNITSVAATREFGASASYCSSKKFQLMYFNSLRKLARNDKFKLTVTNIQPGFIKTDFLERQNYPLVVSLEKGGRLIFRAIEKKKARAYIPGFWRLIAFIWLCIPNIIWKRMI